MADQDWLDALKEGKDAWLNMRVGVPEAMINLESANLSGLNLSHTALGKIDFHDFYSIVNLRGADLSKTTLAFVDLTGAILDEVNLVDADLHRANLSGASLKGTNFHNAIMDGTILGNIDLSVAKDLETAFLAGSCVIGIDTIARSRGCIPEVFLHAAGVQEDMIAYSKSLANSNSINYASDPIKLFFCYAREDEALRKRLELHLEPLRREGLIVTWCDQEISAGKDYSQEIKLHLAVCRRETAPPRL